MCSCTYLPGWTCSLISVGCVKIWALGRLFSLINKMVPFLRESQIQTLHLDISGRDPSWQNRGGTGTCPRPPCTCPRLPCTCLRLPCSAGEEMNGVPSSTPTHAKFRPHSCPRRAKVGGDRIQAVQFPSRSGKILVLSLYLRKVCCPGVIIS